MILTESDRAGLSLPFSKLHKQLLSAAEASGLGDEDNSVIIQAIEQLSINSGSAKE